MPEIETEVAHVNVGSRTFRFISPNEADRLRIPDFCNSCHSDKTAAWATEALKGWKEFSAWRVVN
ncbi:MAG: hypothetical protein LAP40_25415 [Acidobacteriia bacterium]|nr:hypothetical protein [Terriglobia bacterium]